MDDYEPRFGDGREESWPAWLEREQKMAKRKGKVEKVMHEWKAKTLHSGSKHGPIVKSRRQALAIAMSEAGKSKRK